MTKRVSLEVEWDGRADEVAYAGVMAASLEQGDKARSTRITSITAHTGPDAGRTIKPPWSFYRLLARGPRLRIRRRLAALLGRR